MKILSWNVNSIKTVRAYHPWCDLPSFKAMLEKLDADLICFQEMKLSREKLGSTFVSVDDFDAYFAFSQRRKGFATSSTTSIYDTLTVVCCRYSGVTTYVRRNALLRPKDAFDSLHQCVLHYGLDDGEPGVIPYSDLDAEGRSVITDHHVFVLFNIYFPNDAAQERMAFKMEFSRWVERIVNALISNGRSVIVVGDLNVCHMEIDHCDPQRAIKERGVKSYDDYVPGQWLTQWLVPSGPMVDTFRYFHPTDEKVYSHWDTFINARPANYGTRIDYVLCDKGVIDCVEDSTVEMKIMGSDHCPVVARLSDEKLRQHPHFPKPETLSSYLPPKLCTSLRNEVTASGKGQRKISSFFKPVPKAATTAQSEKPDGISTKAAAPSKLAGWDFHKSRSAIETYKHT
jgi:AP endonuclease-2